MHENAWILEVLQDLQQFAMANGLRDLNRALAPAAEVARGYATGGDTLPMALTAAEGLAASGWNVEALDPKSTSSGSSTSSGLPPDDGVGPVAERCTQSTTILLDLLEKANR